MFLSVEPEFSMTASITSRQSCDDEDDEDDLVLTGADEGATKTTCSSQWHTVGQLDTLPPGTSITDLRHAAMEVRLPLCIRDCPLFVRRSNSNHAVKGETHTQC